MAELVITANEKLRWRGGDVILLGYAELRFNYVPFNVR